MSIEQAIQILEQMTPRLQVDLQTHQLVQQALAVIKKQVSAK